MKPWDQILGRGIGNDCFNDQYYRKFIGNFEVLNVFYLGNMATIMMLDWIGPKPILMLSLLFSAVTSLCLIYSDSAFESFIICCLYSLISVFSWNSLNVLNSYLFPVEIRSTATGMMNGANRIGGWLGSLSIGLFLAKGCGLSMLFLCFVILIGLCATMKLHMPRQLTVIK